MDDYLVSEDGQSLTTESGERLIVKRKSPRWRLVTESGRRLTTQSGKRLLVERDLRVSAEFSDVDVELQDDGTLTVTWDGEFHNVESFEILHSEDDGETWQVAGTVSGSERSLNFPADSLGKTKVVAKGAGSVSIGSSDPAADDEQNEEPPPTYSIHDLGTVSEIGTSRGVNDSGEVTLLKTLPSINGDYVSSARLWKNGTVSVIASEIYGLFGPTQDGKIYYTIIGEPEYGPDYPQDCFFRKGKIYLWQNGMGVEQGGYYTEVRFDTGFYDRIDEIFDLAFLSAAEKAQMQEACHGISGYVIGERHPCGTRLSLVNDAGRWTYGGIFEGRCNWAYYYELYWVFIAGVANGSFFSLTADEDVREGLDNINGYCPAMLLCGAGGAVARSGAKLVTSDVGVVVGNQRLPGATGLIDINSAAGGQYFVLGMAGEQVKVWAYDGARLTEVALAGEVSSNGSGVVGRKISRSDFINIF